MTLHNTSPCSLDYYSMMLSMLLIFLFLAIEQVRYHNLFQLGLFWFLLYLFDLWYSSVHNSWCFFSEQFEGKKFTLLIVKHLWNFSMVLAGFGLSWIPTIFIYDLFYFDVFMLNFFFISRCVFICYCYWWDFFFLHSNCFVLKGAGSWFWFGELIFGSFIFLFCVFVFLVCTYFLVHSVCAVLYPVAVPCFFIHSLL